MIWYQWLAVMWMAIVGVVAGGQLIVAFLRVSMQKDAGPVAPHALLIAGSIVVTAMAFQGIQW